jgi:hypothetical protein
MIIGNIVSGEDMFEVQFFENAPEGVRCPKCKTPLRYDYIPNNIEVPRGRKDDVVATYDLVDLYSERFVDFVEGILSPAPLFRQVSENPNYFYYVPERVVPFDAEKRQVRFETPCNLCGGYMSIAGAAPAPLKINALPGKGFFRTDLSFGSRKWPLTIVDPELKKALEKQKFKGLHFWDVYSADHPWPPPEYKPNRRVTMKPPVV